MLFPKKLILTTGLLAAVIFVSTTSMQQSQQPDVKKFVNLKVLPKNISDHDLHEVMEEWEHSLAVRCSFCHVRNEETKKMDWANDAKPEKETARMMYKMTLAINKKYFKPHKDSTGVIMQEGIKCYTCHRGKSEPDSKIPVMPRREGSPRTEGMLAPGSQPATGTKPAK
jgi:hypothetical protein